jgi:hypothetical protein
MWLIVLQGATDRRPVVNYAVFAVKSMLPTAVSSAGQDTEISLQ